MLTASQTSSNGWDQLQNRIAELIQSDRIPAVETLAVEFPYVRTNEQLWLDCIYAEFCLREDGGQSPSPEEFMARFPEYSDQLRKLFEIHEALERPSLFGGDQGEKSVSPDQRAFKVSTRPTIRASQATNPSITGDAAGPVVSGWIGGYRILNKIASGGMGVVYKAHHPQLDRVAAIKLIKSGGLDDGDQARRFELEARAAAKLDHRGIVPVYEIGKHDGRLFLAMAYVEGESLSQRVLKSPLEPLLAARIMQQVAEAVESAHQQGIVHRDLKPQNILLTTVDQPRVTDFGLAKHQGTDSSLTGTGDVLGTPSYMPPEQASGKIDQVGPLSDVYALGATLYAVLTGRPPFQAASTVDTLFQVLNQEPIPPRALNPAIPIDMETVCLKALQKDPGRRYASAQDFADDLARFQNGEAILARPVGRFERIWRWCRKEPVVAGLSVTAALLLITVTVISSMAYFRERQLVEEKDTFAKREHQLRQNAEGIAAEKDELAAKNQRLAREANAEREKAVQLAEEKTRIADEKIEVSNFLITLFRTSDPLDFGEVGLRHEREAELTAREILERALKRLASPENAGVSKPIRATLLDTLGDVERSRGELETAEKLLTEAQRLWQVQVSSDDPSVSENLLNLGKLRHDQGRFDDAEELIQQALRLRELRRETAPLDVAEAEYHLARVLSDKGRISDAERLLQGVMKVRTLHGPPDSIDLEQTKLALMQVLLAQSRHEEVVKMSLEKLNTFEIGQAYLQIEMCERLRRERKFGDAEHLMRGVVTLGEKRLGAEHPLMMFLHINLAGVLRDKGDMKAAICEMRMAVEIAERKLGEHPAFVDPALRFAEEIFARGKFQEAERLTRRAVRIAERPIDGRHLHLDRAKCLLARILMARGEYVEAEHWVLQALNDSLPTEYNNPGPDDYNRAITGLVKLYADQGKFEEAERYFRTRKAMPTRAQAEREVLMGLLREQGHAEEALQVEAELLSEVQSNEKYIPHEGSSIGYGHRGGVLELCNKSVEAEPFFQHAVKVARTEYSPQHPELALRLLNLGRCSMNNGHWKEAEAALREGVAVNEHAYGPDFDVLWFFRSELAQAVWMMGESEEARQLAKQSFERLQEIHGEGHPRLIETHTGYARLLNLFGDVAAAEAHYRLAVEMAARIFPPTHPLRWKAVPALADVLIAVGKPGEAKQLLTAYLTETTPLLPEKSPRLVELRERIARLP